MSQKNYVVEGKYKGGKILNTCPLIIDTSEGMILTKRYISSYTVLDEFNVEKFPGLMPIGVVGVALYGATAKEYLISIEWKDWRTNQPSGETSVILIDDEYYKQFVLDMV